MLYNIYSYITSLYYGETPVEKIDENIKEEKNINMSKEEEYVQEEYDSLNEKEVYYKKFSKKQKKTKNKKNKSHIKK